MKKRFLFLLSTVVLFSFTKEKIIYEDRVVEDQSRITELITQIIQLRSENESLEAETNSLQSETVLLDNMINALQTEINRLLSQLEEATSTELFTEIGWGDVPKIILSDVSDHGARVIGTLYRYAGAVLTYFNGNGTDLDSIHYALNFDETVIISASAHYTSNLKLTIDERTREGASLLQETKALLLHSIENYGANEVFIDGTFTEPAYVQGELIFAINDIPESLDQTIFVASFHNNEGNFETANNFYEKFKDHILFVESNEYFTSQATPALAGYISTILSENRGMSPKELKQYVFGLATQRNIITRDFILEPNNPPNYVESHDIELTGAYVLNIQ